MKTSGHTGRKNSITDEELLEALQPLVQSGAYMQMSIREICSYAGITTGIFYRRYESKEDLLASAVLKDMKERTADIEVQMEGKSLRQRILLVLGKIMESSSLVGPDGMLVFIKVTNPGCNCEAHREYSDHLLRLAIEGAGEPLSEGRSCTEVINDLTLLVKGMSYEWYTKREEYDFLRQGMALIERVIDSLL